MTNLISFLLNGLTVGCIYALIAVGYTMVYGIIKLINFAHGEFYMFGAYIGFYTLIIGFGGHEGSGREVGLWALIVATLVAGLATGILAIGVERVVYRPLRKSGRIVALLAALGMSLLLQNLAQRTVGANDRAYPPTFATFQRFPREKIDPASVHPGDEAARDMTVIYTKAAEGGHVTDFENIVQRGHTVTQNDCDRLNEIIARATKNGMSADLYAYPAITVFNKDGVILLTLGLVSVLLFLLVQHTKFGRAMRAVSHDFDAASLMGVNVDTVITGTFFVGAFVAGVGGSLSGMYYPKITPLMGLMPGLKAFVAAVIGGIGSIPGALVGALLLGVSEALVNAYVSPNYSDAFTFAILIVMLLVRPNGLLGKAMSDKL